jgi:probable phosphoglycerate mutase
MTVLFLVRHAATDRTGRRLMGRTPGVQLSDRGRRQAEGLADRFARVPLAAVYASPLERCRETAAPLARSKGLRVAVRSDLLEVDYGDWTGRALGRLARTRLWRVVQQVPSQARFPGGESLVEVQGRAVRAADAIAADHPAGAVAIVSHGDVIGLLLAHLLGAHLDAYQRIAVEPASVSIVALGDGRAPKVLRVNDTGSLDTFGRARLGG